VTSIVEGSESGIKDILYCAPSLNCGVDEGDGVRDSDLPLVARPG
jgi:hypothetical protein